MGIGPAILTTPVSAVSIADSVQSLAPECVKYWSSILFINSCRDEQLINCLVPDVSMVIFVLNIPNCI